MHAKKPTIAGPVSSTALSSQTACTDPRKKPPKYWT